MKNACYKAAYVSRSRVVFEGNTVMPGKVYDFSRQEPPVYHEVLLPEGASESFKSVEKLWNLAERTESRKNSQTALEIVLALPDDAVVTLEDRKELVKTLIQKELVDKGLAAQIDIHQPKREIEFTKSWKDQGITAGERGEIIHELNGKYTIKLNTGKSKGRQLLLNPKEFSGFIEKEHNWHAHVLVTTRRFDPTGKQLGNKARDLMPGVRKGRVISGSDWGKLWSNHQNEYFKQKGYALQVDHNGIVPQEHLGPVRMRGRAFSLMEEHDRIALMNQKKSKEPDSVLKALTKHKSFFTKEDLDRYLDKHTSVNELKGFKEKFWSQDNLIHLVDRVKGEETDKWTSKEVFAEERKILRIAEKMSEKRILSTSWEKEITSNSQSLNEEQSKAFKGILGEKNLSCIQGYAGTGKSYLLNALKNAYTSKKIKVRGFGPDSATANVLIEKGLENSENIHRFLFGLKHGKREITKGKEVWIVDEAGKLGNQLLSELLIAAEKKRVKVILSGDAAQLPSVDRGGMFAIFCQKFGSHELENIQRQKETYQREISKKLAKGKMGAALDQLSCREGLKWTETKKESIEALVSQWAKDKDNYPGEELLMVAHKNSEVRVLNELARLVRKSRGEIQDKEYFCETAKGDFYASVNDKIEFRANNKELGVTNGQTGVLIYASERKFTVAINQRGKASKRVSFNPKRFTSYQLGYASTYYRCQGRTVDRAYVLHSSSMNKEMFYVGLTRHEKDTALYLSKDETFSLADLKRQAYRKGEKSTTLQFTSQDEIVDEEKRESKRERVQELKGSEHIRDRVKGHTLSLWGEFVGRGANALLNHRDRKLDKEFYGAPKIPAIRGKATAVSKELQLKDFTKLTSNISYKLQNIPEKTPLEEKWDVYQSASAAMKETRKSSPHKDLIEKYVKASKEAQQMKEVSELEAASRNIPLAGVSRYRTWQKTCGLRNALADEVLQKCEKKDLETLFSPKAVGILTDQSSKHRSLQERLNRGRSPNYNIALKENLDKLLYRLYPDGPTQKSQTNYRFGAKGALSVVHSGEKAGQFYDFETQEGGGPLSLIQHALFIDKDEAKEWARAFLGVAETIQTPVNFQRATQKEREKNKNWVSLVPEEGVAAPKLNEIQNSKLHYYYEETARYPYKDENGRLLYYVLRLQDKEDRSKKITPPLSFGYEKEFSGKGRWALKGYQPEGKLRTLYHLEKLNEFPKATILIVEGEKTADRAHAKFPNHNFLTVTWSGGAGSVEKTDWSPLSGRKVLIWPDNDEAGFKASAQICSELKNVGVQSLHVIDRKLLQEKFPKKWDLADELPEGMEQKDLQRILISKKQKALNPEQLLNELKLSGIQIEANSQLERRRINEILAKTDERLRDKLEKDFNGDERRVNEAILAEAKQIIGSKDVIKGELLAQQGRGESFVSRLLHQCLVFQAESGRKPSQYELTLMKRVIRQQKSMENTFSEYKYSAEEKGLYKDHIVQQNVNKELSISSGEQSLDAGLKNEKIRRVHHEKEVTQKGVEQTTPQPEL
ncbi:MAG: AAA family ATPase (plasmid) [Candidatus Algichlamydia australiensis]|nr:AAA family ATPase [Chlamydiales bacterium]